MTWTDIITGSQVDEQDTVTITREQLRKVWKQLYAKYESDPTCSELERELFDRPKSGEVCGD